MFAARNLLKSFVSNLTLVPQSGLSTLSSGMRSMERTMEAVKSQTLSKSVWPSLCKVTTDLLSKSVQVPQTNQVRNWGYNDRMMLRDIKRREILRKFAPERVRLQTLKANNVLPKTMKVIGSHSCLPLYILSSFKDSFS